LREVSPELRGTNGKSLCSGGFCSLIVTLVQVHSRKEALYRRAVPKDWSTGPHPGGKILKETICSIQIIHNLVIYLKDCTPGKLFSVFRRERGLCPDNYAQIKPLSRTDIWID